LPRRTRNRVPVRCTEADVRSHAIEISSPVGSAHAFVAGDTHRGGGADIGRVGTQAGRVVTGTGKGLQVGADDRQAIGVLVEAVGRNASQLIQVVLFEVGQQAREPAPARGTDAAASGTLPLRASI